MAKKLYTEVGGYSKKVKKLYTEVGGVSHKVKKLYMEVNGLSKLAFNAWQPFTYAFSTHPDSSPILSSYSEVSRWDACFDADGTIRLDIAVWNATDVTGGAPAARVTINYVNPTELVGKTVTVTYNKDFDTSLNYNEFWWFALTNTGGHGQYGSLSGSDGEGKSFSHVVAANEAGFFMEIVAGSDEGWGGDIVITSITVDGEEVLR